MRLCRWVRWLNLACLGLLGLLGLALVALETYWHGAKVGWGRNGVLWNAVAFAGYGDLAGLIVECCRPLPSE
ncbi:hypothetical protein F4803DRAFT_500868 [Xylaria telfairii]|nr:hypothetical protein F4803DRAFT_500868 [Xylaria telfairii]